MEPGIDIKDIRALEDLATTFQYTGNALARITNEVDAYLAGVNDNLAQQLKYLEEQVELAKEDLEQAKDILHACYLDNEGRSEEEKHDCKCEERDVKQAEEVLDNWQKKYERGKQICDASKRELDDYRYPGSFCYPPGGQVMMEKLTSESTQNAINSLNQCLTALREIQESDMGNDEAPKGISNPYRQDEEQPLTEDERARRLQGHLEDKKEFQADRAKYQDANRAMKCPSCGKPLALCNCKVR